MASYMDPQHDSNAATGILTVIKLQWSRGTKAVKVEEQSQVKRSRNMYFG